MISSKQQAYLAAMDIGVWQLRDAAIIAKPAVREPVRLKMGAGSGGVLLVSSADVDSASLLANDIGRSLGCVPVWAWPDTDKATVLLSDAIEENLFTAVGVLGRDLAASLFGGELPSGFKSARLVVLPSMSDIETSADARRTLWTELCQAGMVVS